MIFHFILLNFFCKLLQLLVYHYKLIIQLFLYFFRILELAICCRNIFIHYNCGFF